MTNSRSNAVQRRLTLPTLFTDRPEESQRLRMLTLVTMVWAAVSLTWVSGDPWIPLGGSMGAGLGHWISWRLMGSPLGWRSLAILLAIVTVSILMRGDLVNGIFGDRLPVAQYLLLIQAIASFGLRTRGGLYAQLGLSGLVLFFVSERSFDPLFVAFLIIFLGLFLTFNAMAFIEDGLNKAKVHHWPVGQLNRFWFWLGIVGTGLLMCAALAFALLPPDYRGHAGSQRTGIVPFLGESPQNPSPYRSQSLGDERGFGDGLEGVSNGFQHGSAQSSLPAPGDFSRSQASSDPSDVVMHVRSPVTSYWRGRVFTVFDGRTWRSSDVPVVDRTLPNMPNFYWQAYFMEQDQPDDIFVGYRPVRLSLPEDVRTLQGLTKGSIYAVLSQQPGVNPQNIRADEPRYTEPRYQSLPASTEVVLRLADDIVGDATNSFDRLWRIVSYLRANHTFDPTASNQLQLSGTVESFLASRRPGTSLDFATATVLLARGAGLPARLAVGYLPGKYDPYSGTHKVKRQDIHAWAEVHFRRHGWVAFDGTPRPELERFASGQFTTAGGGAYILRTRIGGGLFHALQDGTSDAARNIGTAFEGKGDILVRVVVAAVVASLVLGLIRLYFVRVAPGRQKWAYTRLGGEARRQVLRTYGRLESLLRRKGFQRRGSSQTLTEYLKAAAARFQAVGPDLEWFAGAVRTAAYDPVGPDTEVAKEANQRFRRIRAARLLAGP